MFDLLEAGGDAGREFFASTVMLGRFILAAADANIVTLLAISWHSAPLLICVYSSTGLIWRYDGLLYMWYRYFTHL